MKDHAEEAQAVDALLDEAVTGDRATHLLALFLGHPHDEVLADLPASLDRALRRLPGRGPLRRHKDRRILWALRTLIEDLPADEPLRKQLRWRMEEAEWRARLGRP
ncbi:MAG: hypothetical protein RRA92_09965 [Gemmatimonadota bacterium]|nr:hypothetical protein [Gemmatimonadota bacterium]